MSQNLSKIISANSNSLDSRSFSVPGVSALQIHIKIDNKNIPIRTILKLVLYILGTTNLSKYEHIPNASYFQRRCF